MKKKRNGVGKKNLFFIYTILILMFSVTTTTYAYLEFSGSDSNAVGVAGAPDLEVTVAKITPTSNTKNMVPQVEKGLDTAVSTQYNCVDPNNNVVCHIYKIDVTNTGDTNVVVDGILNFTNPSMPNLMYRLMDNATTLGTNGVSRYAYEDMDRSLINDASLNANQTKTYYMVTWIDESGNDQYDTGKYTVTVRFEASMYGGVTSTFVNYMIRSNSSNFRNDAYVNNIKNVAFVDYIDTSSAEVTWDMSSLNDGSIMAWLDDNETSGFYDLYIGSNEVIYGSNMSYFFDGMKYVDSISFNNLDTSYVTDMEYMFYETGYNSEIFTLNLGDKFDTSNVTKMREMFYKTGYNSEIFTLDLGSKFDTSNVTAMGSMFYSTGYSSTLFTLDLGDKFDTSNVTDMYMMFYKTGYNSPIFILDLGDKFDTSKVPKMNYMFDSTGYSSTLFTLDLGDKFDTSNVTNMKNMFKSTGRNSTVFTLDLGDKFDTSSVTDMGWMFTWMGEASTVFTLDLGDKFDTSNVTNMNRMFTSVGKNSLTFTLDLGDKFDTSKVTDMGLMFDAVGQNSTVFTLNLGNKFDTSKVTDMAQMFRKVGYANSNLVLDLSTFTFDNVNSYSSIFDFFSSSKKIYVKDASAQAWIINNSGNSSLTTSNVLIKG